jgi:hypothetical protein
MQAIRSMIVGDAPLSQREREPPFCIDPRPLLIKK